MKLEDLHVYQMSLEFEEKIWMIVSTWDYFNKDTLGKQLVRAADSISGNIAEGYGRYFYKENRQFCYYSRGSLLETKNRLQKGKRRNLITPEQHLELESEADIIHKKLNAYIKSIGKKMHAPK